MKYEWKKSEIVQSSQWTFIFVHAIIFISFIRDTERCGEYLYVPSSILLYYTDMTQDNNHHLLLQVQKIVSMSPFKGMFYNYCTCMRWDGLVYFISWNHLHVCNCFGKWKYCYWFPLFKNSYCSAKIEYIEGINFEQKTCMNSPIIALLYSKMYT